MEITSLFLIIAVVIIVILLFFLLLPYIRSIRSDTPDDTFQNQVIPHPFNFKNYPNNPLTDKIVEAVNRMGGIGDDAEKNYQASLDALRSKAESVIPIIVDEYNDLAEDLYQDRWSLVQLLAELKHPASLSVLDEILSSQIPPERSKDPHSFTTVGEEIIIRTTAVEALTRMSADGNTDVLELLLKHARHENFSIKRACIQGYLAYGGRGTRQKLLEVLPQNDHHILDIRKEDVRNVPQARGEEHLAEPERDEPPPSPQQPPLKISDEDKD